METEIIIPIIAALLGLLVGAGGVWAAWISERSHEEQITEATSTERPVLGPGVLSVLAAVPYTTVVLDAHDRVVRADASAYAYGMLRDERLADSQLEEIVELVRQDRRVMERECELTRGRFPSSPTFPVMVRVAPLRKGHVLILAEDLSGPRRLEETRRDFTANISHELKTPVGAIQLLAETIEDNSHDTECVEQFAHRLGKEAKRLSALISDIIDLSRLQAPDALEHVELVDIDDVVHNAVDMQRLAAEQADIALVTSAKPTGAAVWGDCDLLTTAVRNLIDNAIRYSQPQTNVSVGVILADDLVKIAVVDQGCGVPVEEQSRIFERFYRVDPGRSRATGGTGLGLSIVKHVAADHGGTVTVWSQPGRGSTFTLVLPQAQAEPHTGNRTSLAQLEE